MTCQPVLHFYPTYCDISTPNLLVFHMNVPGSFGTDQASEGTGNKNSFQMNTTTIILPAYYSSK